MDKASRWWKDIVEFVELDVNYNIQAHRDFRSKEIKLSERPSD